MSQASQKYTGPNAHQAGATEKKRAVGRPAGAHGGCEVVSRNRPDPAYFMTLKKLVERGDDGVLDGWLTSLHPADVAELFEILDRDLRPRVLARLDIAQTAGLMEELSDHLRDDLAQHLEHDRLSRVIAFMASNDAADLLADLPEPLAKDLIASLPRKDRQEVEVLLEYPDNSAGGLMQLELVSVPLSATVKQAVEAIRAKVEEVGDLHFVYVVDKQNRLAGMLGLEKLILSKASTPVRDLMDQGVHAVTPEASQEAVARIFKRYDLVVLPVIDERGRLLGRILHDDAVDALAEKASEDILHMAGVTPDEVELVYTDQMVKIAAARLPWLLATLVGLQISALLYWQFQLTFPQMLALIPFIPVISAMGGNMGSQSSIIVVRGFATGRVDFHNMGRVLSRELMIGSMIGVACGLVSGGLAVVWQGSFLLSVTVTLGMIAGIVMAALVGVLIPYLFRAIKIDPAIATGPFVTTLEDILATSIYYLIALLIISR